MKKKNEYRLYNLIFPLWLMVWIPGLWWLLLIPANFLLDSFVLKKCFTKRELDPKPLLKKYSWRTCLFGFLADFLGALLMLGIFMLPGAIGNILMDNGNRDAGMALLRWNGTYNVWHDPLSFIIALACTAVSAQLIYIWNRRMLAKNSDIGEENAKYTAKWLAVITAPYLYLMPFQIGG